jgi:hypothetical protein
MHTQEIERRGRQVVSDNDFQWRSVGVSERLMRRRMIDARLLQV